MEESPPFKGIDAPPSIIIESPLFIAAFENNILFSKLIPLPSLAQIVNDIQIYVQNLKIIDFVSLLFSKKTFFLYLLEDIFNILLLVTDRNFLCIADRCIEH